MFLAEKTYICCVVQGLLISLAAHDAGAKFPSSHKGTPGKNNAVEGGLIRITFAHEQTADGRRIFDPTSNTVAIDA